jgi:hypothetical protein
MKTEVTVKIKVKDVTLELSMDEAAELAELLRKLTHQEPVYIPTIWQDPKPWDHKWDEFQWVITTNAVVSGDAPYYNVSFEPKEKTA